MKTYGETFFDEVMCPIIVSEGREFLSGQVRDTERLEDDIIQEKEENEREPGCRLFRVYICSWILCGRDLNSGLSINKYVRTHPGIEWNILGWDEGWNNCSSKCQDSNLRPHEQTLVKVEGLKDEGSKRVDVPIAVNNPCAKQNPDEMGVCNIGDLRGRRYSNKSQDGCIEL